ncbi:MULTISPECIES: D-amino acid dehydrogenase [unclassified Rhizobium]|uniref:D-amino acid dehydrogenase n=1 Tax=unclassified Rhizobium TaxID=2613769 RepID=UPI000BA87D11|nr:MULTISPECIES: D-amino acid dehydrogenase [unclassified Rhizobium]ASW10433.1 amino acid dehydrogenase [Rhizobium sp. 11515TR]MDK4716329.1 D-amino acid dehydrogenase [Rhizobium sp. CNPSo 4039]
MHALILGGGVVGITTAYQLLQDGYEVTVLEQEKEVAESTSWGNAGMIAPGHSFVWSSPAAPKILLKSLFMKNQALRFRLSADPHLYGWSMRFLMECTAEKARLNTLRKHRLAIHSQSVLRDVVTREAMIYDRTTSGIIYFHRNKTALETGIRNMRLLESDGQEIRVIDADEIVRREPALLDSRQLIAGGILCPTDETGNSSKFTKALAEIVRSRGGRILTDTRILKLERSGNRISRVLTSKGEFTADNYVLSLGSESPLLARKIGLSLPIYPIKGYSLTIPITDPELAPKVPVLDEHNLVAITPMGDAIRVTATAEFAGYDRSHKPSDFAFMMDVTRSLFPKGIAYDRAHMWAGLRPMTPDNLPVLGRRDIDNLWLNTGHGHIGWTMSHGSARIIADLMSGRSSPVTLDTIPRVAA